MPEENEKTQFDGLGFLFAVCSAPPISLAYWLSRPEFSEEMQHYKNTSVTIDDALIFKVMKAIYLGKLSEREKSESKPDFNYSLARKALRRLSEKLYGTRDFLKDN